MTRDYEIIWTKKIPRGRATRLKKRSYQETNLKQINNKKNAIGVENDQTS